MRWLLYSDLHIRPERFDDCIAVLKSVPRIFRDFKCDRVLNGGDTFETRGLIETHCLQALHREYSSWYKQGIRQTILVGNHDQEDRDGFIHPMDIYSGWDGWAVIDEPVVDERFAFFPYMKIEAIHDWMEANQNKIHGRDAFVHWGIKGAKRNDWNVDTDGVPVEWLKPFRRVFSGHYHFRNQFENVQYIGSPIQQDFGEKDQDKGVLIFDSDKNTVEFVGIRDTSRHFVVEVTWNENGEQIVKSPSDMTERDFLEVVVSGDSERVLNLTKASLEKQFSAKRLKVSRQITEKSHSRLNIASHEVHSTESLMQRYVDFIETDLDKKRLKEMGRELLGEL